MGPLLDLSLGMYFLSFEKRLKIIFQNSVYYKVLLFSELENINRIIEFLAKFNW